MAFIQYVRTSSTKASSAADKVNFTTSTEGEKSSQRLRQSGEHAASQVGQRTKPVLERVPQDDDTCNKGAYISSDQGSAAAVLMPAACRTLEGLVEAVISGEICVITVVNLLVISQVWSCMDGGDGLGVT
jgi:hypothetical protein